MAAPNMSIGPSPPTSPVAGDLWYNDVSGLLFIWYVDATSAQWVVANPGIGAQGLPGDRGPPGPPGPPYAAPKRVGTLYQAQPFDSLVIDTTVEAIRIMMPPAPSDLDSILFSPANDTWGNPNLLIVDFQGQLINTHADILAGDVPTQFELVFYAGYGWRLHSQHGGPETAGFERGEGRKYALAHLQPGVHGGRLQHAPPPQRRLRIAVHAVHRLNELRAAGAVEQDPQPPPLALLPNK